MQAGYFDGKHYPILTDDVFPADPYILEQSRFWFAIYVEVGDDEGLLHDPLFPSVVFRKIRARGSNVRATSKLVDGHVRQLRNEIRTLLSKDSAAWTTEERTLKAIFPSNWDSTGIALSLERIRFQRGLQGRFREGLERSYRYLPLIDSIFAAKGIPDRLKYLPHVESSFYPYAYSKVGAAGMWQFMKASGRDFKLQVGYHVDERRDPYASTLAAGRMLSGNFSRLKTWPLAIVAYNHGPSGMAKAVRVAGTRDLGTLIKTYNSGTFGFASKNFYASFLAASSIAMKADSLYPNLKKMVPLKFHSLVLAKPLHTQHLATVTGLSPAELEEYNLALRPATFRGKTQLPKGFVLKLPATLDITLIAGKLQGSVVWVAKSAKPPAAVAVAVAVAVAEEHAGHRPPTVTEKLPEATLPMTMALDKVGNRDEKEDPLLPTQQPKKKRAKKNAKLDKPKVATATLDSVKPAGLESTLVSVVTPTRENRLVDSTLALQATDMDKLAHPMDRFNPAIYQLDFTYVDGYLTIQAGTDETLSHYAEWAGVPEKTLKRLNRLKNAKDFRLGKHIRIPVPEAKANEFVKRRKESYQAIEEDFYANYYVAMTEPLQVQKGMNLWAWSQDREIPFWLLQKHNPGKILNELHPGDSLNLPVIETGVRKWGFTRYADSKEYLAGIARFLVSGKADVF